MRRAELEDLAQRLSWYGSLRHLTRDELREYVLHRCAIVGAAANTFDDRAMEALFEMGKGNPRATDHHGTYFRYLGGASGSCRRMTSAASASRSRRDAAALFFTSRPKRPRRVVLVMKSRST